MKSPCFHQIFKEKILYMIGVLPRKNFQVTVFVCFQTIIVFLLNVIFDFLN